MYSLNRSYFIIGLVSLTVFGSGCQKAASSGVRAKKGVVSAERNQDEARIEKLLKAGKSVDVCDKAIIEKNTALKAEIAATMSEIQNLKKSTTQSAQTQDVTDEEALAIVSPQSGLSVDADKSLVAHSQQIKQLTRALIIEFVNKDVASCGKSENAIGVANIQKAADEAYIAIAEARKSDTPDSLAARANQGKKDVDSAVSSDSLLGQKLKLKKELIEVVDEANQANFLFVTQGQKGSASENYQIALNDSKNGVCLLEKAPMQKLKEDSIFTILKTEVVTSESLADTKDTKAVQKTDLNLLVRMGSGDLFFTFNCKLKNDLKKQSAASQFIEIFGALLTKQPAEAKE
jgi:hypothetical protein